MMSYDVMQVFLFELEVVGFNEFQNFESTPRLLWNVWPSNPLDTKWPGD